MIGRDKTMTLVKTQNKHQTKLIHASGKTRTYTRMNIQRQINNKSSK